MAAEKFAREFYSIGGITNVRQRIRDVQIALIVGNVVLPLKTDEEVAEILICPHGIVFARWIFIARPQTVFIQDDPLGFRAAQD